MFKNLLSMILKEFVHLRRDFVTLVLAFALPLVEVFLFGHGISGEARYIPLAVYDEDATVSSRSLVEMFENSSFFKIKSYTSDVTELHDYLTKGEVKAALHIPKDYSESLAVDKPTRVQLIIDGINPQFSVPAVSTAGSIEQYKNSEMVTKYLPLSNRGEPGQNLEVAPIVLYNPEMDVATSNFVISGLLALILTQSAIVLSSIALVRERERGTFEQLIVTPVGKFTVLVGKMVPYIVISFFNGVFVVALCVFYFGLPFRGSPWLLAAESILFLAPVLGMGLLISTFSKTQLQAIMIALFAILVPIFTTGFVWAFETMPLPIQLIGYIFPMTYFLTICRFIMFKGVGISYFWQENIALGILAVIFVVISLLRFKKRVD
jgi:ABC-2 type transport system permease protein